MFLCRLDKETGQRAQEGHVKEHKRDMSWSRRETCQGALETCQGVEERHVKEHKRNMSRSTRETF